MAQGEPPANLAEKGWDPDPQGSPWALIYLTSLLWASALEFVEEKLLPSCPVAC